MAKRLSRESVVFRLTRKFRALLLLSPADADAIELLIDDVTEHRLDRMQRSTYWRRRTHDELTKRSMILALCFSWLLAAC